MDRIRRARIFNMSLPTAALSRSPPRRQFISKFTGTAGTAVVTTDKALLWTDGRYFLQVGGSGPY